MHPGANPHIEDMIGRQDGIGVVFDNDHRVAQIPEFDQRVDQFLVVALVQDRYLAHREYRVPRPAVSQSGRPDRIRWASPPDRVPDFAGQGQIAEPDIFEK